MKNMVTTYSGNQYINNKKWLAYIIFIIPFLIIIIAYKFLTTQFLTFHYNDELYHYNVIIKFANEFPQFDLADYYSGTTPLFHIFFSAVVKVIGTEIFKLRLLNALISYLAICSLFNFLHYRVKISFLTSGLYSLIFLFSPYFFGLSFLVMTDNLALLFCILSIDFLLQYYQSQKIVKVLISIIFMSLTVLTRQTFIWLSLSIPVFILISDAKILHKLYLYIILGLSLLPLFYLFYIWKGVVPPVLAEYHTSATINIIPIELTIAIIGLYYSILNYRKYIELFKSNAWFNVKLLFIIIISFIWLIIFPIGYKPYISDGYLMRASSFLPDILSTGILFWVLFPLGILSIYISNKERIDIFSLVLLLTFLFISVSARVYWQKYYDFFALLIVFLYVNEPTEKTYKYLPHFVILIVFIFYSALRPLYHLIPMIEFGTKGLT